MFRIVKIGENKYYAVQIDSLNVYAASNIIKLIEFGDSVLLVDELEDAAEDFGVDLEDIEVIE